MLCIKVYLWLFLRKSHLFHVAYNKKGGLHRYLVCMRYISVLC